MTTVLVFASVFAVVVGPFIFGGATGKQRRQMLSHRRTTARRTAAA